MYRLRGRGTIMRAGMEQARCLTRGVHVTDRMGDRGRGTRLPQVKEAVVMTHKMGGESRQPAAG